MVEWTRAARKYWPWAMLPLLGSLLFAVYKHLDNVAMGNFEPLRAILIKEMGGGLGTVLLLLPMVWASRRFPLFRGHGLRFLPLHAAFAVLYSVLHTSWNWGFREALYPVFGLGDFNYGRMPTRYFMEMPLDLIAYSIVAVVVMVVERYRAARARELQVVKLQEQLQRTRLAQLQSQLRPHFLFNSLNTVSSVMYQDVDRADSVLQALSDILRKMVDQSDAVVVPLSEELELIDSMVEIMEARFGDRLQVTMDVDGEVRNWPVPPLLLQPMIENAIQHAMPDGSGRLDVTVRAAEVHQPGAEGAGRLRLEVLDNGPGLPEPISLNGQEGVGIKNTRERIETHYGDAGSFELRNGDPRGLHVIMEVPWTESAP